MLCQYMAYQIASILIIHNANLIHHKISKSSILEQKEWISVLVFLTKKVVSFTKSSFFSKADTPNLRQIK